MADGAAALASASKQAAAALELELEGLLVRVWLEVANLHEAAAAPAAPQPAASPSPRPPAPKPPLPSSSALLVLHSEELRAAVDAFLAFSARTSWHMPPHAPAPAAAAGAGGAGRQPHKPPHSNPYASCWQRVLDMQVRAAVALLPPSNGHRLQPLAACSIHCLGWSTQRALPWLASQSARARCPRALVRALPLTQPRAPHRATARSC